MIAVTTIPHTYDAANRLLQAEIILAWAYSPNGAVLIGKKGPMANLGCGEIYDWSTGLIFKDRRYFDPMLEIWLALARWSLGVVGLSTAVAKRNSV